MFPDSPHLPTFIKAGIKKEAAECYLENLGWTFCDKHTPLFLLRRCVREISRLADGDSHSFILPGLLEEKVASCMRISDNKQTFEQRLQHICYTRARHRPTIEETFRQQEQMDINEKAFERDREAGDVFKEGAYVLYIGGKFVASADTVDDLDEHLVGVPETDYLRSYVEPKKTKKAKTEEEEDSGGRDKE